MNQARLAKVNHAIALANLDDVYLRVRPRLLKMALRRMRGELRHQAEDVVQWAWIQAQAKLAQCNKELEGWLVTILKNRVSEIVRSNKQCVLLDDFAGKLRDSKPSPEEQAIKKELSERLRNAIAALPLDTQVVLNAVLEGNKLEEIAQEHGIPLGTVKIRVWRAKPVIAKALGAKI